MQPVREGEKALVDSVRNGDRTAFETLFHQYKGRVYSLCLRLVGDAGEAEDLTQKVFFQLFRKVHTFRGESAFGTWLHRMAANTALMYLRRKTGPHKELPAEGLPVESPSQEKGGAARNLDRIHLDRAIAALPPGYRSIFVLHDVEGYDHQEIAEFLGCTPGTSKSQLHKARLKLRELLRG